MLEDEWIRLRVNICGTELNPSSGSCGVQGSSVAPASGRQDTAHKLLTGHREQLWVKTPDGSVPLQTKQARQGTGIWVGWVSEVHTKCLPLLLEQTGFVENRVEGQRD